MTLPTVGVVRDRFQMGAFRTSDVREFAEQLPLDQALSRDWPTWAHLLPYFVTGPGFDRWPRLNKRGPILDQIRKLGGEVVAHVVGIDVDNPGHGPWHSREDIEATLATLENSRLPAARQWAAFYTTKGGYRLLYDVSHLRMPVDIAEPHIGGLIRDLRAHGIMADESCKDWCRLFGLPRVVRDGRKTWLQDYYELIILAGEKFDLGSVAPDRTKNPGQDYSEAPLLEALDNPKPVGDCFELLNVIAEGGGTKPSPFVVEAKRRLRGRRCYGCVFEHRPIAEEGARDSTIQSFAGEAVAALYHAPGSSPEAVYALFLESVRQLRPDAKTADWTDVLWSAILRYWTSELSKANWATVITSGRVESAQARIARMIDGARIWSGDPALHADDESARRWVERHALAVGPTHVWVMGPDGRYDAHGVSADRLALKVQELGQEGVIPLRVAISEDKVVARKPQQLIEDHGTLIREVEGVSGGDGTYIRGMGTERPTLVLRLFRRKNLAELEPRYDPDVAEWLERVGGEDSERLKHWIGLALAVEDGPICALSIAGVAGIGKKLLVQGLAECFDTETYADGSCFGAFQGRLKSSPLVWINEGIDANLRDGIADKFRRYTGGDPVPVNEKFEPEILLRIPLRVIVTTNNTDVLGMLCGTRDLTPADREALALRLFHIDATHSTAAAWIRGRGGLAFTAREGRRWIKSDAGGASDFVVARHFLHLYHERPKVPHGARLLFEGRMSTDVMQGLTVRGGSAPAVIEAICRMIERPVGVQGISANPATGVVCVTCQGVVEYARNNMQASGVKLTHRNTGNVLKGQIGRASCRERV